MSNQLIQETLYNITTLTAAGADAGTMLNDMLAGRDDGTVRELVKSNPQAALVALQSPTTGLTPRGAADVLEIAIEDMRPDAAAELMQEHLTTERLVELIAGRGDLDAVAALVAPLQTVLAAIVADCQDTGVAGAALYIKAWAVKLKKRENFSQLMDMVIYDLRVNADDSGETTEDEDDTVPSGFQEVDLGADPRRIDDDENPAARTFLAEYDDEYYSEDEGEGEGEGDPNRVTVGPFTFGQFVAMAVFSENTDAVKEGDPTLVTGDEWVECGLEPEVGQRLIRDMAENGDLPRLSSKELTAARNYLATRQRTVRQAPKVEATVARAAADIDL